jgi:hypothetical protein
VKWVCDRAILVRLLVWLKLHPVCLKLVDLEMFWFQSAADKWVVECLSLLVQPVAPLEVT